MRRLRHQLIAVLLVVALLPAIPAVWTARELLERSLGGGEEVILEGARAGLAGARELLELEKDHFARRLAEGAPVDTLTAEEHAALDPRERQSLETLPDGGPHRTTVNGIEHLVSRIRHSRGDVTWVIQPLPPDLVTRAQSLAETVRRVETLKRERGTIVRGLVFTFLSVYGVILVLVIILGLLLAARLTRPLQALGEGIDRVAEGDLSVQVDTTSTGHLSRLAEQFNRMTGRLQTQQDELVRLEKLAAWRNLARRLAHEIKNPLTPIQLATQQMRDAYSGNEPEYRKLLEEGTGIVEEEVRSLRTLVKEFSEFARLPEPAMRTVPVQSLIDDLTALYGGTQMTSELSTEALTTHCDPDEIHRVLINLINNGLEAQKETGNTDPVTVRIQETGGRVLFEVADRGPGVSPENRDRVFAPDFSTKSEGMGLGLAIVEGIVQAHGGRIDVADHPGGGAVFCFTLPVDEPGEEEDAS